ncbi:TolC family protein [Bizionia sediminis]|uniref:TolC family protein n=1 Tax=Bizionia sediminis TaxID=1737064 RepID=A0ABW5KW55_9FLAO
MRNLNLQIIRKAVLILCSLFFVLSSQSQELETLINEALANSPEIQKFDLKYKIASEKVNEVNSLPNTEFNLGVMAVKPEMDMPMERFRVSVMQMLPWFGTITARENYVSSVADAQYVKIIIAKRNLMASVSEVYYNLYANKAKQKVLTNHVQLLKTYETLALTAVEIGKASAVDVLRLQIRQNELRQLKDELRQQFLAVQTNLNKLLNRKHTVAITVVDSLIMPSEDFETPSENLAWHPELLRYDKLYQSVEQSELLNQKEMAPMVGIGVEYISQENSPMITSAYKDMVMPMLSVSIPIFNKKYRSQSKQNELKQQEISTQKQERLNTLETHLAKAIRERIAARLSHETLIKNLQHAQNAEAMLLKSYETGTIDFKDILDIQELTLKFQIKQIEAVKAYYVQTTVINYLTQ